RALEKLEADIAAARAEGATRVLAGANTCAPSRSQPEADLPAGAAGDITPPPPAAECVGEPYQLACLSDHPSAFAFDDGRARSELLVDLQAVLEAECPVHLRIVGARLAARWGIGKVTAKVRRYLAQLVIEETLGTIHDEFVWAA